MFLIIFSSPWQRQSRNLLATNRSDEVTNGFRRNDWGRHIDSIFPHITAKWILICIADDTRMSSLDVVFSGEPLRLLNEEDP